MANQTVSLVLVVWAACPATPAPHLKQGTTEVPEMHEAPSPTIDDRKALRLLAVSPMERSSIGLDGNRSVVRWDLYLYQVY